MRGIDFSETHYRRLYQSTPTFKLLGRPAQCVYWALRTILDPGGFFKLHGSSAAEALAVELGWFSQEDIEFIATGLERLLERQWIYYVAEEDALFDPEFYDSEHAAKSDRQRAREYRQRGKKIRKRLEQVGQDSAAQAKILSGRFSGSTEPVRLPKTAVPDQAAAVATVRRIGFKMPDRQASLARVRAALGVTERESTVTKCDAPVTIDHDLRNDRTVRDADLTTRRTPQAREARQRVPPVDATRAETAGAGPCVTIRDVTVTKCDAPVTECRSYSYYPYPNTHKAASLAAPLNPYPDGAGKLAPEAAAAEGEDQAFTEYADQVAAIFENAVGTARLFNPAEGGLIADWFQRGIDLQVIAETIREKAGRSRKPVQTLLYFREPVQEAWAGDRELKACDTVHHDPPPIDFEARLGTLEAMLQAVPALATQVATLRGQAQGQPEQVEKTLQTLEEQFLDALDLTDAQVEDLRRAISRLAQLVSADELAHQQVRMARRIKREALGIPSLSLFSPEVSNPGPTLEVPT